ncbi:MAG: hypothetical protein E2O36_05215, partial [Proteobacteria bacterium]
MTERTPDAYVELERQLETRTAELAEERAYQSAISDVLRIISESPSEIRPVFQAIAERAMTMCNALGAATTRFDGELVHLMGYTTSTDVPDKAVEALLRAYPMELGQAGLNTRAVRECATINV